MDKYLTPELAKKHSNVLRVMENNSSFLENDKQLIRDQISNIE